MDTKLDKVLTYRERHLPLKPYGPFDNLINVNSRDNLKNLHFHKTYGH